MKTVQIFTDEYLEQCRSMTPEQIVRFLEDFRLIHSHKHKTKSKLISLKIDPSLLGAFKTKCKLHNIPYQTQIKKLMKDWLDSQ